MEQVFTILHISDPHFGTLTRNGRKLLEHFFEVETSTLQHPAVDNPLARKIIDAVKGAGDARDSLTPNVVVLTGDFICSGSSTEPWTHARHFVKTLRADFGWSLDDSALPEKAFRILVVPGNHDINRGDNPREAQAAAYENYRAHFLERIFNHPLQADLLSADGGPRRHVFQPDLGIPVVFACFWSPFVDLTKIKENLSKDLQDDLERDPWKYDHGRILDTAFRECERELRAYPSDQFVRIAVLHHHIAPKLSATSRQEFKMPEYNILANAPQTLHWLYENRFSLVLHGHAHEPISVVQEYPGSRLSDDSVPRVAILGSATVGLREGQTTKPDLGFQVVRFRVLESSTKAFKRTSGAIVDRYVYNHDRARFVHDEHSFELE